MKTPPPLRPDEHDIQAADMSLRAPSALDARGHPPGPDGSLPLSSRRLHRGDAWAPGRRRRRRRRRRSQKLDHHSQLDSEEEENKEEEEETEDDDDEGGEKGFLAEASQPKKNASNIWHRF